MRALVLTVSVMSMALPAAAQHPTPGWRPRVVVDRRRHERDARQYPPQSGGSGGGDAGCGLRVRRRPR